MLQLSRANKLAAGAAVATLMLAAGSGVASAATPRAHVGGSRVTRSVAARGHRGDTHTDSAYTVRFQVWDATTDPLRLSSTQRSDGHWRDGNGPYGLDLVRGADYTLESEAGFADGGATYVLGDTGYRVKLTGKRWLGTADAGCAIQDALGKDVSATAPYKCQVETLDHSSGDLDAYFVVEPKQAETHRLEDYGTYNPRNMAQAYCGGEASRYADCQADVDDTKYGWGNYRVSSDTLVNCSSSPASQSISSATSTGTTTTLGVKAELNGKLFWTINAKLEVSRQQVWSQTNTTTRTVNVTAQPGEYAWIESAQRMQLVTGDFRIHIGNQTYDINDVTVSAPMSGISNNGYRVRSMTMTDQRATCSDSGGSDYLDPSPQEPQAGGVYSIGLHGHNGKVVTAPGTGSTDSQLQIDANANTDNQQWVFAKDGDDYQIRSQANPQMCLFYASGTGKVSQHLCVQHDDEYWDLKYEPSKHAYVVKPADRGVWLGTEGSGYAAGTKLIGSTTGQTWEFTGAE